MNRLNQNKLVILTFLLLPSLLWVSWSFKMTGNFFSTDPTTKRNRFEGVNFLEHSEIITSSKSYILESGVCPLGKFGAWVTFIWSAIMLISMYSKYSDTNSTDSDIDTFNKIIGGINISIVGIIFILSLIMNYPLFIRTLPYFIQQIAISIILLQ